VSDVVEHAPTGAAPTGPATVTRAGEGYRPHLDGLRAVAVYLVVLFHAGVSRFSGGFIGVDVFFVLSGYLVTQLLMRDLVSRGVIRFPRFYARRMRRLLPASLAALLITAVVYSAIASRAETTSAVNAFKASFLYVANWFFIRRSSDYFASDINNNPVVHFWSLAVEEQFYFFWPILLGGLYAATRRFDRYAHRAMQLAVASGALVSLLWALRLAAHDLNRAYYGTDTRAYQLLAGALLALSPGLVRRAATQRAALFAAPVALLTLVLIATSRVHMSTVHRGIAATITTAALIVAIEGARGGPVNRLLSSSPVVYLGKISYGTYLWHWPVIVVALAVTNKTISPLSTVALSALLATGLASLSYHIIERPIREGRFLDGISPIVIGAGLGIAVLSALVIIPRILDPLRAHTQPVQATTTAGTPIPNLDFADASKFPAGLGDVHIPSNSNCTGQPSADCWVVAGSGATVLVIGDSHAQMFTAGLAKMAETQHLKLFEDESPGCPWQRDVSIPQDNVGNDDKYAKACIAMKHDLYTRVIRELKPDLVIAISKDYLTRWVGVVLGTNDKPLPAANPSALERLEATDTALSVKAMETWARKVLIVDPIPTTTPAHDPFVCLTKSKFVEDCRFVANTEPAPPLRIIYERLADNKRVYVANIDRLVCPYMPICDPIVNGIIVRRDYEHLTPAFALSLAGPLTNLLQNEALIPSR
jgi:peptidoglycan/LPS O-acetylase OafA/YrhL